MEHHVVVRALLVSNTDQDYKVMIRGWSEEGWICLSVSVETKWKTFLQNDGKICW